MNPGNDLGAELLKQDGAPGEASAGAAEAMVQQAIAQARRQVRAWGWAAVILWIAAGAHFFLVRASSLFVRYYIYPQRLQEGQGYPNTFSLVSGIASLFVPVLLCAAALCTMKYILVSRQATLRQIQAELADISAEIKRLAKNRP